MTDDQRKDLLGFWSGSRIPPLHMFNPAAARREDESWHLDVVTNKAEAFLPEAQVCSKTIMLPQYSSKEMLKANLFKAIELGGSGYHTL